MDRGTDLPKLRLHLDQVMSLARHDRWMLGALRDGKLKVVADSSPDPRRPYRRTHPLSHLARRCLHERRPLALSSAAEPASDQERTPDWEQDWPALLYAPVGMPRRRPVGLLIVGSRTDHWYPQDEIDYLAALAVTLTAPVLCVGGPLARLSGRELETARLIALGLSAAEMAAALRVGIDEVREVVGSVLRKLALRSPGQLIDVWPRLDPG